MHARELGVIVCHCQVVNDRAVRQAVQAGATTLAQVCRLTGAGTDCGSCVFSVKRLLCEHEPMPQGSAMEVQGAAS